MSKPSLRHDHTAWLTHFVRDRKPSQDFPGRDEDECGSYAGGELDWDAPAFEVLKTIIRLGGLLPGHSFRKGRTTIYGGQPVVCATEMPLYAFALYARERVKAGNVSAYGISFLKSEFHRAGGRQAIYGLAGTSADYVRKTATSRILTDDTLPLAEQFRYVAHDPNRAMGRIDWSHEREWRWIPRDPDRDWILALNHDQIYDPMPALPLFKGAAKGCPFTRACIIVWSSAEAQEIRELLTGLLLAGSNNYGTPFDAEVIRLSRIIVLEDVMRAVEKGGRLNAQTIEGLEEAQLLSPVAMTDPPPDAAAIVARAFAAAERTAARAGAAYVEDHGERWDGAGFAHATTTDVTSPIVQYLLATGQASGPFDGEVWIGYPGGGGSSDIGQAEAVCRAAASTLSRDLGISVYVTLNAD